MFEQEGKIFLKIRKNIENYLIFQPSRLRAKRIQRNLLKKFIPQRFVSADGVKLYAWFIKPKRGMPVLLHLHGQAESILSHQDIVDFCIKEGIGLFMLSYRGHYKSGGKASEEGVFNDAQAAIIQLKKLGVDSDKIVLWGHSLGTVIAVETAINNNVLGVILQCPIKEIKSAATNVLIFYCQKMKLNFLTKFAQKHITSMNFIQKMDNINKIQNIQCPIIILHSKADNIAPWQNSVDLKQKNTNAQLFLSDDGNHWNAEWCLPQVFEFVKSLKEEKGKVKIKD